MKPDDEDPYPKPAWERALDRWYVRFIAGVALAMLVYAAWESQY